MNLVDAHCHLTYPSFTDVDAVVERAGKAGLRKIVTVGTGVEDAKNALALRKRFPGFVEVVAGVAPHDAGKQDVKEFAAFARKHRGELVGIGEIGLDRHHFHSTAEWRVQEEVFRFQLVLAEDLGLPVVLHTRDAEEEAIAIAGEYGARVMLHCFLKPRLAAGAARRGWLVSLPTIKSTGRERIAGQLPLSSLACETDSPFLWDGRNEPANVASVYAVVAAARKARVEAVAAGVWDNLSGFFGFR